ncbi:MAG: type II secretion system F family protein [Pirellulales bacterium]
MESATLDDYLAFNEQLAALSAAGIPLELDLSPAGRSPQAALERINATVSRRMNRGESLAEALTGDDQDLPPSYRSLIETGLYKGNLAAALDESHAVADSVADSRSRLATGFVYPLVICALLYAGLWSLCLFLEPTLRNLYAELRLTPSPGLLVLELLRATLPVWAVLAPLVVLAFLFWSWWRRGVPGAGIPGAGRWIPGWGKTLYQERCARFATTLAELLEDGVHFGEALRVAGDGCGDAELRATALRLAENASSGSMHEADDASAKRLPPFLRWAIWHADETTGRVRALQIAARMYRETAERRAARFRTVAPLVALVLVAGTATLVYALLLFVPLVQLLYGLSAWRPA